MVYAKRIVFPRLRFLGTQDLDLEGVVMSKQDNTIENPYRERILVRVGTEDPVRASGRVDAVSSRGAVTGEHVHPAMRNRQL